MKKEFVAGIFMVVAAVIGVIPASIELNNKKRAETYSKQIELLVEAEEHYKISEYEKVLAIYSDKALEDNGKCLLNIGVMYANGEYYKKDSKKAIDYFLQAYKKGEKYYSLLYIIKLLPYQNLEQLVEVFEIGCNENNRYIEKILQELYMEQGLESNGLYIEDFKKKKIEEKEEILSHLFICSGQAYYKVVEEWEYIADINEEGEYVNIQAYPKKIQERPIDIYINKFLGDIKIEPIFK